jgi:hypothetical protein
METDSKPGRHPWRFAFALVLLVAAVGIPLGVLEAQPTTVAVVGDSLSAESLPAIEAYLELFNDRVVPVAQPGSGILDTEVNWQAHAASLIAEHDPSVVVVEFIGDYGFLGARPGIASGSPAFFAAWAAAAQALEDTLSSRGATVYWVVGPPVANPTLQATISELDAIYAHLKVPGSSAHPPLIDVTPAMSGGTGTYQENLPGPGGAPIAVRTPDGTHFTLYGTTLYARAIAEALR